MQRSDDRPPASGRPSLLSAEQQGEADRQRILAGLENKPSLTTAGAQKARHGAVKWVAAGAAVLALTAGAGAWLVSEGEKEIVLAGTAPLPATPAPAAPLASEPVATGAIGEEVSTAAILQDTPVMAEKLPSPAPVAAAVAIPAPVSAARGKPTDELKSLLEKDLPAPVKRSPPPLVLADAAPYVGAPAKASAPPAPKARPGKPAPAKPAPAKPPAVKATPKAPAEPAEEPQVSNVKPNQVKKTVVAKADAKAAAKADAKAKAKPAPVKKKEAKVDNDVALLAALVAHSKATQPRHANSAAAKLRQCKTLGSVADAEQCRIKLCAGSAKNEAECKPPKVAKAAAES